MANYIGRRVVQVLDKHGDGSMTLRRTGQTDLVVKGKRFGSSEEDTGNTTTQSLQTVRIGNVEIEAVAWPGPPKRTDQIIIGSRTLIVRHVDSRKARGEYVAHIMTCAGA